MSRSAPRVVLLALVLAAAGACGGDDGHDGGGPDDPGATVELDGLVLMTDPIHLLDPNTGKRSAPLSIALGLAGDRQFVVSPDGTRIAYFAPDQGAHHLVIASFGLDADGTPVFTPSADVELPGFGPLSWPASGDRVVVGGAIVDPATGAITTCSAGMGDNDPDSSAELFPDGSYRCPTSRPVTLERDGLVVATNLSNVASLGATADAQVLDLGLHIPSGAQREISISNAVAHEPDPLNDYLLGGGIERLAARDGDALGYQAAPDGTIIVDLGAGPTARTTMTTLVDGHRLDILGGFAAGAYELGESVPGATRLAGLLDDGDGRRFAPVMMTGDGRVIYAVISHVIASDPLLNVPHEAPVESALQEIRPDGTTRGFRTSELARLAGEQPGALAGVLLNSGALAFELDDGDWLYPSGGLLGPSGNRLSPSYVGYLTGEASFLEGVGVATGDGTWFLATRAPTTDTPGTLCVRAVARDAEARCMTLDGRPTALDLVGDRGEGPPVVRATSRAAAWPGAPVVIYGARFGASPGTITVGDVPVPASAITSWTDHRIDFTMDASSPAIGQLRVTTAAGPSRGRAFWLGKTARIPTPFDGVPVARIRLGQGQNYVPATALPAEAANVSEGDTVVVWSEGGADEPSMIPISVGPYTRQFHFLLQDRLADDVHWQLVRRDTLAGVEVADVRSNFDLIAGEFIDHDTRHRPLFGARVLSDFVQPRSTTTLGLPDFWRAPIDDATTSWVLDFTGLGASTGVSHLLGWTTSTGGRWGYRETATGVGVGGYYMTGVAATGDVVLVVGGGTFEGSADGVLRLSHDGGQTWSAQTRIAGTETGFVEPIAIHDDAGDYFLVFEAGWITSGWGGGTVRGVHRVDLDGTFTPDVTPVPAISTTSWMPTGWHHPFDVVQSGSRLLVFAPESSTLVTIDLAATTPTWTTLPAASDAGSVRNIFHDTARGEVVILMKDGTAARATDAAGWTDVASYDFGFDVPHTRVLPLGLMRAPDGRWLVNAALYAIGSDDASPFGENGWLLSPPP